MKQRKKSVVRKWRARRNQEFKITALGRAPSPLFVGGTITISGITKKLASRKAMKMKGVRA